jgi:PAS domain S-box-containing protein
MSPNISLAIARTATTNGRRLALVICFSVAMILVDRFVSPVHDGVYLVFLTWIACVALYQAVLGRARSASAIDTLQTVAFLLDITFLSVVYETLGGASWMGASLHAVIAMSAFAALPARTARIVAGYAAITFVAGLLAQSAGYGPERPLLNMAPVSGNYAFAAGASVFGLLTLAGGASVQHTFVRIMRRAQDRYRLILDTATDWIVMTDTVGVVRSASWATSLQTGLNGNQVTGIPFADLLDESVRDMVNEKIRATVRDGEQRQFEASYRTPDGATRWLLCNASQARDEMEVSGVLIVARDITERLIAAEQLQAREAMLAETEQMADIGSWRWHLAEDRVEWSDQLYRIFGMERKSVLRSQEFFERVHPEDLSRIRLAVERGLATGTDFEFDHRIVRTDGTVRSLHSLGRVLSDSAGLPTAVVGSVQDITERTSLTDQLRQAQKMEAVGRLAGGISHDFNNIMMVMKTYADILEESVGAVNPKHRRDVEQISKAIDRASALTRQLLVFSRRQAVEVSAMNLNKAIGSFEGMISRLVGEDVDVRTKLQPDLWMVNADGGQIQQIIMNLVVNSRDAMPHGGVVTIETSNVEVGPEYTRTHMIEAGSYAMIAVTDSGVGMTREVQSKVFEPFFTTKDPGSGTGLGLSIVYGIVKQSKGHVWIYSEPGKGTTVKIYLPRAAAPDEGLQAPAPQQDVKGGTERILLVEDEETVRDALSLTLRTRGYTVIEARNGAEALRIWESDDQSVDLVVTDMVMPEVGGRDLAKRVLELKPETPVLFMSGYTEDSVAASGMPLRASAFLEKPFTASALLLKAREMLDTAATP